MRGCIWVCSTSAPMGMVTIGAPASTSHWIIVASVDEERRRRLLRVHETEVTQPVCALSTRATPCVSKSQTATRPSLQPHASILPRRLNAQTTTEASSTAILSSITSGCSWCSSNGSSRAKFIAIGCQTLLVRAQASEPWCSLAPTWWFAFRNHL